MSPVQISNLNKPVAVTQHQTRSLWPMAIALVIIIIGAGWWFLIRPQWQAYKALPVVDGFEASRQAVANEISSLKVVTDDFAKLTATDRKRLELALPQGEDLPNLLAQFEGIAKATNFTVTTIGFSAPNIENTPKILDENGVPIPVISSGPSMKELKINVIIKGGEYKDLKAFIAAAEQSIRLLKLSSVSFAITSSNRDGVSYTLNFITSYLSN